MRAIGASRLAVLSTAAGAVWRDAVGTPSERKSLI
jgi:hypothetical protein